MAKIDRRFIKSENELVNALVVLLNKKELSEISISSLVKQADLNKSTFYLHFTNIEQVLIALQDRLISEVYALYQESSGDVSAFIDSLLDVVKKSKRVYRTVLSQSTSSLVESVYLTFFGPFKASINKKMDSSVYKRFSLLSGVISSLRLWSVDTCLAPKDELATFIIGQITSQV